MAVMLRKQWKRLAVASLLLGMCGWLVVKPALEIALRGSGGAISAVVQAVATAAEMMHDAACHRVAQAVPAQALLGEPLVFAPVADVRWLSSDRPDTLEFEFEVAGATSKGMVRATAHFSGYTPEFTQLLLTTDDGMVYELGAD